MQIVIHDGQTQEDNPFYIDSKIKEYNVRLKQLVKLSALTVSEKK